MRIRKVTKRDELKFIELDKQFILYQYRHKYDAHYKGVHPRKLSAKDHKKLFSEMISKKNSQILVAVDNGEFIGFLYGYIIDLPKLFDIGRVGYIDGLFVSEDYRRSKVGTTLKNEFIKWLKTKNVSVCQILTSVKNAAAKNVYKNWGFSVDEYRMYKKI